MKDHRRHVSAVRSTLTNHRSVRERRRRLVRELATYRTPAERLELAAILARHTDDQVRPIERILSRR